MSILNNFWQCSSVGADVLISSGGGGGSVQFHSSNLKKLTTLLDFFQNSQVISTTLCTFQYISTFLGKSISLNAGLFSRHFEKHFEFGKT